MFGLFVVEFRDFKELKTGDFVNLVDQLSKLVDLGCRFGEGEIASDEGLDFFFNSSVDKG